MPLIVIVGETASGKSALGIQLAEQFNGEIICADSRTVYKGMDIGTAKPTKLEQKKVPHHLLDVVEPNKRFTAADFKKLANQAIADIINRGKLPIMVGGTGLYVDAVLYDFKFSPAHTPRDPQNPRHLLQGSSARSALRPHTLVIGLKVEPKILRQRIENRVETMIQAGFVDEVKTLAARYGWDTPALNAPGYKAFKGFLAGELDLNETTDLFIKNDLNLAKRQRTWFKRNKSIHWLTQFPQAEQLVRNFLTTMASTR